MASKYWYKTGADAKWTTVTGNWWSDAVHTVQAASIPASGDDVYMLGTSYPLSAPPAVVTLHRYDTSGYRTADSDIDTQNLKIAENGILIIGNRNSTTTMGWDGDATAAGITILFQGYGCLRLPGSVGNNAIFQDYSSSSGRIGPNATFKNFSSARGGFIEDGFRFDDYSSVDLTERDLVLNNGTWNSLGTLMTYNNYDFAEAHLILRGDLILQKPCTFRGADEGTGNMIFPRRELDAAIGTGGSKLIISQAYGFNGIRYGL